MAYYKDLREYLEVLEIKGKLIRVKREINKDTEMHPLMRLQFRGLEEDQRKGFLFENVMDSRGRTYDIPVVSSVLAGSREIYAIGMMCEPDEIGTRWSRAQLNPIPPVPVEKGPVQEEIHLGDNLLEHGGLDEFPIPVSTPGYDAGPFITSPYWITKDPETGVYNMGTYRAHVKSPTRTGMMVASPHQHIAVHWKKCKQLGKPLQAALVIGGPPSLGYVSVAKLPQNTEELAVAGGIAGTPVEVVMCRTVDLYVPAHAEVVLEGILSTDAVEPEAPFGEALGYMGQRGWMPYFELKCITHRKKPIWQTFFSQFPPSESSKIRQIAWENNIYKLLYHDLGLPVQKVACHESCGSGSFIVLQMGKAEQSQVWRSLESVVTDFPFRGKVIVAVDEDINPYDADAVNWAISFRIQPRRDTRIIPGQVLVSMDHSLEPPGEALKRDIRGEGVPEGTILLINATLKWPYPPVSLPAKKFMERALQIWNEEKMPPLKLKDPWFGYNLGYWTDEYEQQAEAAVNGEYYRTGEALARMRKTV